MGALLFCFFSAYCAQFVTNKIGKPLKNQGFSNVAEKERFELSRRFHDLHP